MDDKGSNQTALNDPQQAWLEKYNGLQQKLGAYRQIVDAHKGIPEGKLQAAERQFYNDARMKELQTEKLVNDWIDEGRHDPNVYKMFIDGPYEPIPTRSESIGGAIFNNYGAELKWDTRTLEGRIAKAAEPVIEKLHELGDNALTNLGYVYDVVREELRPFTGGATPEEAYAACSALVDFYAGGGPSKLLRNPAPLTGNPVRDKASELLWEETGSQAFQPGEGTCRFFLGSQSDAGGWIDIPLGTLAETLAARSAPSLVLAGETPIVDGALSPLELTAQGFNKHVEAWTQALSDVQGTFSLAKIDGRITLIDGAGRTFQVRDAVAETLVGTVAVENGPTTGPYSVKSGETLSEIARDHDTTVETLLELNPDIENRHLIFQDQKINLPTTDLARGPHPSEWHADNIVSYAVESGDTLWAIAKETGVPFDQVLAANQHLNNPDLILPGQQINIPKTYIDENGFINAAVTGTDRVATVNSGDALGYANPHDYDPIDVTQNHPPTTDYTEGSDWNWVDVRGPVAGDRHPTTTETLADDFDAEYTYLASGNEADIAEHERVALEGELSPHAGALGSGYGLYAALQGDNPLTIANASIGFTRSLEKFDAIEFNEDTSATLGNVGLGIGATLGTIRFFDSIEDGNVLGAASAGFSTAVQISNLAGASGGLSSLGPAAGGVGAFTAFAQGDIAGGIGSGLMQMGMQSGNPYLVAAGVVVSVFGNSLFDEAEPYEAPTGDGHFYRTEDGDIAFTASGTAGNQAEHVQASLHGRFGELNSELSAVPSGDEIVKVALQHTLTKLQDQLPDELAIIPERLPALSFNGFFYIASLNDPTTGVTQQMAVPRTQVMETLESAAYYSQAMVPHWEAETIAARLDRAILITGTPKVNGRPMAWMPSLSRRRT